MCVNTRISNDLYQMLYSQLIVEFRFELSDLPVHFEEDWWPHDRFNPKVYWCGYRHMGVKYSRMSISDRTFAFLTHISLSKHIGVIFTSKTPSHTRHYYARVVRRQANSIHFIATHCPNLLYLKFDPHVVAIKSIKRHQLEPFVKAYKQLVQNCVLLKDLEIFCPQHYGRCGCSTRDPRLADINIKVHEKLQVGETRDRIEVDRVGEWVKDTLVRIRLHRDLLIECPKGLFRRPGVGIYHGEWFGRWSHNLGGYSQAFPEQAEGTGSDRRFGWREVDRR